MMNTSKISEVDKAAREVAQILRSDEPMSVLEGALDRLESALGIEAVVRDGSDGKVCPSSEGLKTLEESLPNDPPRETR